MTSIKLDRLEFGEDDTVFVKLLKIDNNGKIEPHRTAIPPGTNPSDQMRAVNDHLVSMGYPKLVGPELASIVGECNKRHTPAVIKRYNDKQAEIAQREI